MPAKNDTTKPRICDIQDCDLPYMAKGYCNMHYQRFKRHGSVEPTVIVGDDNARFDSYVMLIPFSTCHYWVGTLVRGYGKIQVDGKKISAHRYSYERAKGKIPAELLVRHSCHTKICVNPDHLSTGTHGDNVRDMMDADRQARGSGHGMVKLTADDVIVIRADPRSHRTIASDYGVCHATIGRIKRRETWGHV